MSDKKFDPKKLNKLNNPQRLNDIPPALIVERLSLKKLQTLIDIGAGTGLFSVAFHQQLQLQTTYACDLSQIMIDWMDENICPQQPQIITIKSEESNIPLDNDIGDLVLMINLHHELEEQTTVVREAYRLLKPGGKLCIIDWKKEETEQGPPLAIRCETEQVLQQLEQAGYKNLVSYQDLAKHFLAIGEK